jgi:hypothetical protein
LLGVYDWKAAITGTQTRKFVLFNGVDLLTVIVIKISKDVVLLVFKLKIV